MLTSICTSKDQVDVHEKKQARRAREGGVKNSLSAPAAAAELPPATELSDVVRQCIAAPGKQLTADESIECLTQCIAYGKANSLHATNAASVVLLGETGAGKSTFANYVNGRDQNGKGIC